MASRGTIPWRPLVQDADDRMCGICTISVPWKSCHMYVEDVPKSVDGKCRNNTRVTTDGVGKRDAWMCCGRSRDLECCNLIDIYPMHIMTQMLHDIAPLPCISLVDAFYTLIVIHNVNDNMVYSNNHKMTMNGIMIFTCEESTSHGYAIFYNICHKYNVCSIFFESYKTSPSIIRHMLLEKLLMYTDWYNDIECKSNTISIMFCDCNDVVCNICRLNNVMSTTNNQQVTHVNARAFYLQETYWCGSRVIPGSIGQLGLGCETSEAKGNTIYREGSGEHSVRTSTISIDVFSIRPGCEHPDSQLRLRKHISYVIALYMWSKHGSLYLLCGNMGEKRLCHIKTYYNFNWNITNPVLCVTPILVLYGIMSTAIYCSIPRTQGYMHSYNGCNFILTMIIAKVYCTITSYISERSITALLVCYNLNMCKYLVHARANTTMLRDNGFFQCKSTYPWVLSYYIQHQTEIYLHYYRYNGLWERYHPSGTLTVATSCGHVDNQSQDATTHNTTYMASLESSCIDELSFLRTRKQSISLNMICLDLIRGPRQYTLRWPFYSVLTSSVGVMYCNVCLYGGPVVDVVRNAMAYSQYCAGVCQADSICVGRSRTYKHIQSIYGASQVCIYNREVTTSECGYWLILSWLSSKLPGKGILPVDSMKCTSPETQ